MPRARVLATILAVAVGLSGCGHGRSPGSVSGAVVFAQECQVCHSLVGNESLHRQGGDLVGYTLSRDDLTSFTREMPTRRRLSPRELRAVVGYVLRAERTAG